MTRYSVEERDGETYLVATPVREIAYVAEDEPLPGVDPRLAAEFHRARRLWLLATGGVELADWLDRSTAPTADTYVPDWAEPKA